MPFFQSSPHGVILRADAAQQFGRSRVNVALTNTEVLSPWRGVLVDAARAAEPLTIIAAARLVIGREAAITGPSAAFLHGLTTVSPTPVHVVVPYETRKRSRTGIVVHNGAFLERDLEERLELPVLGLDRVVTDLACTLRPWEALGVLDEVLGGLPEDGRAAARRRLHDLILARPDPRGTRMGTRLVDLATGRAESRWESWLLWRVVDLGFPVPEANLPLCDLDGRQIHRLDLAWRKLRIAVEYNGYAAHAGREEHDGSRLADIEGRGWLVVVADVDDLHGGARLEKELDEAFISRGVDVRGRTTGALRPRRHRERRSR